MYDADTSSEIEILFFFVISFGVLEIHILTVNVGTINSVLFRFSRFNVIISQG